MKSNLFSRSVSPLFLFSSILLHSDRCPSAFSLGGASDCNGSKILTSSQIARRLEEQRRADRRDESVPGLTSAISGSTNFEMNATVTEGQWNQQASENEQQVRKYTSEAFEAIKMLRLEEAEEAFDNVYKLRPNAYCWQAGLVKFYLGDFCKAAYFFSKNAATFEEKFGLPASEERIWRDACDLKTRNSLIMKERESSDIPKIPNAEEGESAALRDSRPVMKITRDLFSASVEGDLSAVEMKRAELLAICNRNDKVAPLKESNIWKLSSWFYLGLHYDVIGQHEDSKACMEKAIKQCIESSDDILHVLPTMHMTQRNWFD